MSINYGWDTVNEGSADVELYRFTNAYGFSYLYTSSENDVTLAGETFQAVPISREAIGSSVEEARNELVITMPTDLELAKILKNYNEDSFIIWNVTLYRLFTAVFDDPNSLTKRVSWSGRIAGSEAADIEMTVTCTPLSGSLKTRGLSKRYQKTCPYSWGDRRCGINKDNFKLVTTVASNSSNVVTLNDALNSSYSYVAGSAELVHPTRGTLEKRYITGGSGNSINLIYPFPVADLTGLSITVFPGCDKKIVTCDTTYGNKARNGSFPYIPKKDPFSGKLVY